MQKLFRRLLIGLSLLGVVVHVAHLLGYSDPGPGLGIPKVGSVDPTTVLVLAMWGISAALLIIPPALAKVWGVTILQVFLALNAPFAFWEPESEVLKIAVRLACGIAIVQILKTLGFLPKLGRWDAVKLYPVMYYGVVIGEQYALAAGIDLLALGWSFHFDPLSCVGCAMLWHSCNTSLKSCTDPGQRELLYDWCAFNIGWVVGTGITSVIWLARLFVG